ncbi:uncharacterized protein LOC116022864 [Ipomoea triloba]|uniref:uncharacterized protein LOC116022864 n=1 Tax=Ipomoea triloba TaxID=35885 RepID=UPI00125E1152|nr:uncharacterized protein LOC116022864 [Ipomoea triloba]
MGFLRKMRKVWTRVAKRLHIRKTGLRKLDQEVRTCEYEDVHTLWDLLKKNDDDKGMTGCHGKDKRSLGIANRANCAPFLYRGV